MGSRAVLVVMLLLASGFMLLLCVNVRWMGNNSSHPGLVAIAYGLTAGLGMIAAAIASLGRDDPPNDLD